MTRPWPTTTAPELDATDTEACASRGETFRLMGRYEEALADFNRAIELEPGDDDYIMKTAEIQRLIGPAEPTVLLTAHQMALTCGATAPPPWLGTHWAQTAVEDQSQP